MAGRIPDAFIDELLARSDIVEIIDSRVPLKKAGREYTACCPFHNEKTPSFTVSPTKQFYHCFGCGAHGTAVGFLMEYERLGFVDAVEELARQAGLEVPYEGGREPADDLSPLYAIMQDAAHYFTRQLRQPAQARSAVDYLKRRGLSGEIAAEFMIGYAPSGWDNLLGAMGGDEARLELLRRSGLIVDADGKRYDRFRDRIMFPIRDRRGRVIAFGGRVLGDDTPKYLNSPETPIFHKGRELYGLYEARQALRHIQRLLVVEGYMDVVALAQHGIRNAVATLGTATTEAHLEQLFRAAPELVFCFDGDRAGREAGWKALQITLPVLSEGREVRFLFLPEGEDPDSRVRAEGAEAFEARLARAVPLSEYLFSHLGEQVDMASLDGRARFAELARPLVDRLPEGVYKRMVLNRLGELVGLTPVELGGKRPAPPFRPRTPWIARSRGAQLSLVARAVALVIQHPQLAARAGTRPDWAEAELPGLTLLAQLLDLLEARPNLSTAALLERWRGSDEDRHLHRLAQTDLMIPDEGLEVEFCDTLDRLAGQIRSEQTARLVAKSRTQTLTVAEKERLRDLLQNGHRR